MKSWGAQCDSRAPTFDHWHASSKEEREVYLISEVIGEILRKCSPDGLDSLSKGGTTTFSGKGKEWAGDWEKSTCLKIHMRLKKGSCCGLNC